MPQPKRTTVESIKKVALHLFSKNGYHKTAMRDIASAAGVTVATVYHYFPNKKLLFEGLQLPPQEIVEYKEERKAEIAKAAIYLFAEKGYASTTMNDVAKAAKISKPTLYKYFTNKESLFVYAVQHTPLHMTTQVLSAAQAGRSIRSTLYTIASDYFTMFNDPLRKFVLQLAVSESYRFPVLGKQLFNHGVYMTHSDFANYLYSATKCDSQTLTKARMAFAVFLGSLQSYIISYRIIGGAESPIEWQRYMETAVSFICKHLESLGISCE